MVEGLNSFLLLSNLADVNISQREKLFAYEKV